MGDFDTSDDEGSAFLSRNQGRDASEESEGGSFRDADKKDIPSHGNCDASVAVLKRANNLQQSFDKETKKKKNK